MPCSLARRRCSRRTRRGECVFQFASPHVPMLCSEAFFVEISGGSAVSVKLLCCRSTFLTQTLTIEQYLIICTTTRPHCQLYIRSQFLGRRPNILLAQSGHRHSCSALQSIPTMKTGRTETDLSICLSIYLSIMLPLQWMLFLYCNLCSNPPLPSLGSCTK